MNQHCKVNREMPFKEGGHLVISLNVTKERKGLKYGGEGEKTHGIQITGDLSP